MLRATATNSTRHFVVAGTGKGKSDDERMGHERMGLGLDDVDEPALAPKTGKMDKAPQRHRHHRGETGGGRRNLKRPPRCLYHIRVKATNQLKGLT